MKGLALEKVSSRARGNARVEIRDRTIGSAIKEQSGGVGEALGRGEKVRHAQARTIRNEAGVNARQ